MGMDWLNRSVNFVINLSENGTVTSKTGRFGLRGGSVRVRNIGLKLFPLDGANLLTWTTCTTQRRL